jgi:photosystem II stability/assembly factor-like uncharacterized protein
MRKKILLILFIPFSFYSQSGWFVLSTNQGTAYYSGLQFFNNNTGYISSRFGDAHTNGGGVGKTINGGINWISVFNGVSINGIHFINISTGWIYGGYWDDAGRRSREIFRTTNGGINFTRVYLDSTGIFSNMFFTDINTGWAVTVDPMQILKTTNSGYNWIQNTVLPISDYFFINNNTGWGIGTSNTLYKTTNGGANWTSGTPGFTTYLNDIYFIDVNTGWVSGGAFVYKTTNSGNNWNAYSTGSVLAAKLAFINSNTGWVICQGNKTAYTNNGGINWSIQETEVEHAFQYISFADANTGYIAGWRMLTPYTGETIIMKTTNAGFTGIENISQSIPKTFSLYQNYPNPFNPSTKIKFDITADGKEDVNLVVYDALGREVTVLVNEKLSAGTYEVNWNAAAYSTGIYFYKLTTGGFTQTRKMILIK